MNYFLMDLQEMLFTENSDSPELLHCFSFNEISSLAFEALHNLLSANDSNRDTESLESQVRAYILNHLDSPLDMRAVASSVGLSYTYFSTFFRENAGLRFSEYLQQVRLTEARRLLETTSLGMEETAYWV